MSDFVSFENGQKLPTSVQFRRRRSGVIVALLPQHQEGPGQCRAFLGGKMTVVNYQETLHATSEARAWPASRPEASAVCNVAALLRAAPYKLHIFPVREGDPRHLFTPTSSQLAY